MARERNIQIHQFQLFSLLNNQERDSFEYLLDYGVHCSKCKKNCPKGVDIEEIHLSSQNDIIIYGTCRACNGYITCSMDFGEDKKFYEKANDFRMAVCN